MAVNPVQGMLLAVVFVFEVLGLVAVAWWAVSLGGVPGIVVAVVAVSVMAALWGRFAAPRAANRLRGATLAVFMLAWFAVGGVCLAALGHPWWGLALVAGFAATKLLLRSTGYQAVAASPSSAPPAVQGEGPDVGQ
jgi:hypothetical protein